jgi:sugar-phosphatase
MSQFDGVLFDLDGVLIDSTEAIVALWRDLAAGRDRPLRPARIRGDVLGCTVEHTVAAIFGDLDPTDRVSIVEEVRSAEPGLDFEVMPGARSAVGRLASAGVRLGLVTGASTTRVRRALTRLGLPGAFTAMVTWDDATRGKPAPDCYALAAHRLGLAPDTCVAFEDTASGVRAATRAGVVCVGVGGDRELAAAGAAWVVPDLTAVDYSHGARGLDVYLSGEAVATLSTVRPLVADPGGR